ncbi:MAG: ATP-binding protein, partial [Flavitalea sp.]
PLRKIQMFSELSLKNIDDLPVLTKYLEKINAAGQRMTELIKAVLNFSRVAKSNELFVEVDLNVALDNVLSDLELLIAEKNAVIKNDRLPVIIGIPLQINQLFSNLTTNALKFSEKAPEIIISGKIKRGTELTEWTTANPESSYAEIIFGDNGIGFDGRFADKIFAIFQRLHQDKNFAGTGIGLAVCKRIVENHNGNISVKSEPGKGTVFYIYLALGNAEVRTPVNTDEFSI